VAEDPPPTNNYGTQEETPARQDVDVLLDVSELEVDRIKLTVKDLRAHVRAPPIRGGLRSEQARGARGLDYRTSLPFSLPSIHRSAWRGLPPKSMRELRNLYQKAFIDLLPAGGQATLGLRLPRVSAPLALGRERGG
jgi:hypothetical protein